MNDCKRKCVLERTKVGSLEKMDVSWSWSFDDVAVSTVHLMSSSPTVFALS